ncbi:hypothetical protein KM043_013923 [Ampulex compressa]|nr:hypothetical protein KM043_013923 [Ampulex compressa]
MSGTMRQLEERQLPTEVTKMRWSPKMDLLAIVNVKGEVALHRLTWQRVWLLCPQEESDCSVNLAWRPDGKLLVVCYEPSGLIRLVDVENKSIVHKAKRVVDCTIACASWLSLRDERCNVSTQTGDFFPPLPSLNRSFGQETECKNFLSQNLDVLFLGQEDGNVSMYVFGMFYCGTITIGNGTIMEISGGSGGSIWVTWRNGEGITTSVLSCPLLNHSDAFLKVARAQANVDYLMDYLSRTLMAISEAWETILLEMDEKLARYADANPPGGVAADFLELLMIGVPTQNLENFLLRDLTEKGLKKLGHSIEMCYSNIQKLVLKNLTSVGMALVYRLVEVRGMVRLGGPYEALGFKDEGLITDALHASEAFLAKSSEIQQVIDHSMRDYKAFFRWLYVVILRLTDERIPSEVSRVSQQELTFIAEFLRGFDKTEPSSNGSKGVNLEKLGQYLRHDNLQSCLTREGSEWATMLDENRCLRNHSLIIDQDLSFSLLQSHTKLVSAVHAVFGSAYEGLAERFCVMSVFLAPCANLYASQIATKDSGLLVATMHTERKILRVFKVERLETTLHFKMRTVDVEQRQGSVLKPTMETSISDLQFYSEEYLSLLLVSKQASTLMQLSQSRLFDGQELVNLSELLYNGLPRAFHGISARGLAVSGARKVAAVLGENGRKIRLLETEVEPEDEEEEEEEEESLMESATVSNN